MYVDIFDKELKQGDIVVLPTSRDTLSYGVVKSLFWSPTYNKYQGIKVEFHERNSTKTKSYHGGPLTDKNNIVRALVIHTPDIISQSLQDLVEKCKGERWETKPMGRADGTNILSSLTSHISSAKSWFRAEADRLNRIANPNSYNNRSSYGYYNQPAQLPKAMSFHFDTNGSRINFCFRKNEHNEIVYDIQSKDKYITLVELCRDYNVPPPDVVKRIDKIIAAMKGELKS